MNARATVAVPSPFCREKHRKEAQRKAQQPMKAVRMCSGIRAKFRNWRETEKKKLYIHTYIYKEKKAVYKGTGLLSESYISIVLMLIG